jgi:large subunit ribosomal protein L1
MAELEQELQTALNELRKEKVRKFNQTVDLIVNLQKFDARKENINFFVTVPHKIKEKNICAFLAVESKIMDTVTESDFRLYSDKKRLRNLEKKYDFFIAQASLMPKVATTFGRVLGPSGKMPSPQLGIIPQGEDKLVQELKERIDHSIRIRSKEASIKIGVGKQSMKDEELIENIVSIYNTLLKNLSKGIDNVKNVEIKLTMSKPQKIKLK